VNHGEDDGVAASVAEMAALILSLCLSVALCLLFGWHCYLVVNNKTTIEHYEGVRSRVVGPKPGAGEDGAGDGGYAPSLDKVSHPYSLGVRANLREILGRRVACWLAPGCSIAGDGMSFANVASMGYARWAKEKALRESELTLMGED
jgi:palmitoyltransferase